MKTFWIVSYDISDPRRLRKVAKYLEGFGYRLQESVFRVLVNQKDLERMKWEINKRTTEADKVMYLRFCNSCAKNVEKMNPAIKTGHDSENFKII
jgi:CRISPR-associated protein Cas2